MAAGSHLRLVPLHNKFLVKLPPTRVLPAEGLIWDTYLVSSFLLGSLGRWPDPELLWISLHMQAQQAQGQQDGTGQAHEQGQPSMACNPAPLKLPSVS